MQKNIIRIMLGYKKKVSLNNLFRKLKILPLVSQYILTLMLFVIKNKDQFIAYLEICSVDTKQHTNFHQPTSNLTKYQKGIYYSGVRVYNNLPPHIKDISDDPKNFKLQLKQLYLYSFYSLEEYVR